MGAVSAARCPSPAAAVAGVPTPTPALRGDVDGDGEPDASFTLHGQPRDCNYLVVDSTASGRVGVRIPRPDLDDPLAPGVPSVTVLARISPLPGAAIVVTTHEGASTAFAGVYLMRGSRLVRVRIPWCCGLSNSFAYGGSADNYWGLDCTGRPGSGFVASDSMSWSGGRRLHWTFERTVYQLVGTVFVRTGHIRRRVPRRPAAFGLPIFKRCPTGAT